MLSDVIHEILTPEEITSIEQEAMHTVNQKLQEYEQIDARLFTTLETMRTEKRELDEQIRAMSRTQILDGHKANSLISQGSARLQKLKDDFSAVSGVIQTMNAAQAEYQSLRRIYFVRRNIRLVREYTVMLLEFQGRAKDLMEMVQTENTILEPYGVAAEVLRVIVEARGSNLPPAKHSKMMSVYRPYVDLVENLGNAICKKFEELIGKMFDTAILIANDDEKGESEMTLLQEAVEVYRLEEKAKIFANLGGHNADDETLSPIRTSTMLQVISEAVERHWDAAVSKLGDTTSKVKETLEKMVDFTNLMQYAVLMLVELFPESLDMKSWFIKTIHEQLFYQLKHFANPNNGLVALDQIDCVNWIATYLGTLDNWGFKDSIDMGELVRLRDTLVNQAVEGMDEHMSKQCKSTAHTVSEHPIERDEQTNKLFTSGPVDLNTILDDNLSGLLKVAPPNCKIALAHATIRAVRSFVERTLDLCTDDSWAIKLAQEEQTKQEKEHNNGGEGEPPPQQDEGAEPPDPEMLWRERRMYYCIAFSNDLLKIQTNLMELVLPLFEGDGGVAEETFSEYISELLDQGPQFLVYTSDFVVRALDKGYMECFSYDQDPVEKVIKPTLTDFMENDFKVVLEDFWVLKLITRLMRDTSLAYLTTFFKKFMDEKTYPEDSWRWIQRDMYTLRRYWSEALDGKQGTGNTYYLEAIHLVESLLRLSEKAEFAQICSQLIFNYFPDTPKFVIQTIFEKRFDANKKLTGEVMDIWAERVAYQERDAEDIPTRGIPDSVDLPTLMALLPKEYFLDKKKRKKYEENKAKESAKEKDKEKKDKEKAKAEKAKKAAKAPQPENIPQHETVSLSDLLK
eukprot:PhF_6_TR11592/c0_g1_i1/m.18763